MVDRIDDPEMGRTDPASIHVGLSLPADWEDVPLAGDSGTTWLRAWLGSLDLKNEERDQIELLLRPVLIEAHSQGAMALGLTIVPVAADGEMPELLVASFGLVAIDCSDDPRAASLIGLSAAVRADEAAGSVDLLDEPEIVSLGQWDALKTAELVRRPEMGDDWASILRISYHHMLPGGWLVALGFESPCLWLAEELSALFDEIAGTVELTEPSEVSEGLEGT